MPDPIPAPTTPTATPAIPAQPPATAPATPAPASPGPAAPAAPPDPVLDFDRKLTAAFDKDMGVKPAAPATPAAPAASPKPTAPVAPAAPKQPKELRAELDRVSGELTTKQAQIGTLEAKIVDFEKKGKDTEALTGRLKTLEGQLEAIQAENRALKHESSPEFKAKYDKPFNDAAAYAQRQVESLEITDATSGTTRAASFDDFMDVYSQKTFNKAVRRAEELFGQGAASQVVINHVTELQRLEYTRNQALKDEQANAKQREEAERTRAVTQQEDMAKTYASVTKDLADSIEEYRDDPTDKDLTSARTEGYQLFDTKPATVQERIIKNAHIRHRFAAYGPLRMKVMRMQKELAQARKELDTYKTTLPDPTKRLGGGGAGGPTDSWEEGARKAVTG
jgi:hypothetical protein